MSFCILSYEKDSSAEDNIIISWGNRKVVPVTAIIGEIPYSLGIFYILSCTIGKASNELFLRDVIADVQ